MSVQSSFYSTVVAMLLMAQPCFAGAALDTAAIAQQREKTYATPIILPVISGGARSAAGKVNETVQSPEFQKRLNQETGRVAADMLGINKQDVYASYYSDKSIPLAQDERVYVFLSSSVPLDTIRAYAADIDRAKAGSIVLRGFVDGAKELKPTLLFMSSILEKKKGCIEAMAPGDKICDAVTVDAIIDPNLFARYQIERVPAIVFAKGVRPGMPDASEGDDVITPKASNWWVAYGDASLKYSLEYINREAQSKSLQHFVDKLPN